MLRALVLCLAVSPVRAQVAARPGALPVASAQSAAAVQSFFYNADAHAFGRSKLLLGDHMMSYGSAEVLRKAGPFIAALEAAGLPLDSLETAPQEQVLAALQKGEASIYRRYAELVDRMGSPSQESEDLREITELAADYKEFLGSESGQKALRTALEIARGLAPGSYGAAAEAPVVAAPIGDPRAAGLAVAKTLAELLEAAEDEDAAISVATRMKQASKRYADDAAGEVMIAALAKRLTDAYDDESDAIKSAIEEAAYQAKTDGPRVAAVKALIADADESSDSDWQDEALEAALRLVEFASPAAKRAAAEFIRSLADEPDSSSWDEKLLLRADRLDDELRWDSVKDDPAAAVMHALAEELRESSEDAAEAVVERMKAAWTGASPFLQRFAAEALSRNLLAAAKNGGWRDAIEAGLEALAGSDDAGAKTQAEQGLKAARRVANGDEDTEEAEDEPVDSDDSVAEESAPQAPTASSSEPAPAPAANPELASASGGLPWVQLGVAALGVAALLALLFA